MNQESGFGSLQDQEASRRLRFLESMRNDDPRVHVVIGVAGAGKTAWAIDKVEQLLRDGYKWQEIGFTSFSRAACREAAERAAAVVGESAERLQNDGWFRTIHSAAVRLLGLDTKLLLDRVKEADKEWFAECLGFAPGGEVGTLGHQVQSRLDLWDLSRALVVPCLSAPHLVELAVDRLDEVRRESLETLQRLLATRPGWPVMASHFCATGGHDLANENTAFLSLGQSLFSYIGGPFQPKNAGVCRDFDCPPGRVDVTPIGGRSYGRPVARPVTGHDWTAWTGFALIQGVWARWASDSGFLDSVHAYEEAKRLYGRIDFSDILLRLAGLEYDNHGSYVQGYAGGACSDVKVWICDEYQDCSRLLDLTCRRLWEGAESVYLLGDGYQAIYGFSGAQRGILCDWEFGARDSGQRLILNRSWRNPASVIDWGEQVLREDCEYEARGAFCEGEEGSVGLVNWGDWVSRLNDLSECSDVMVVARCWWNVQQVQRVLDERGIPWTSLSDEHRSRWDCPAKIAFVLVMRELLEGKRISEQDWRRVTMEMKQKVDGVEIFRRGIKTEWQKLACSDDPKRTLSELAEWGATPDFEDVLREGRWKDGMFGIIDAAIDRHGIDRVRKPAFRVGTCHAVKGLQAEIVFCFATSTEQASKESDDEALCLKYVTITRASRHYRLIVNQMDMARGKPQFWAAPKGYWQFDNEMEFIDDCRKSDSGEDPSMAVFGEDLGSEVRGIGDESEGDTGHPLLCDGEDGWAGSEEAVEGIGEDPGVRATEDQEEWWDL